MDRTGESFERGDVAASARAVPCVEPAIETYAGAGGATLAYVAYRAERPSNTALVYLHGIESHAGWFSRAARRLCAAGFDVYCLDRRGSGQNREARGFRSGHVDSLETLLEDVHQFVLNLRARYARVVIVGLSWGGKLAVGYSLTHPGAVDGLVLITPGLRAKVDVDVCAKLTVALGTVFCPTHAMSIPIRPEMFTKTPLYLAYIRSDPLRLHAVSARFLFQSYRLEKLIDAAIGGLRGPVELFLAADDQIIYNTGVVRLLAQSGLRVVEAGEESETARLEHSAPTPALPVHGEGGTHRKQTHRNSLTIHRYLDQTHAIQLDAADRLVSDILAWLRVQELLPGE